MSDFLIYDVFTDETFGGNPLAIHPDASDIPEESLQKIAREFNFSETTFVFPPENPAHTARVRIFTPTSELPFAGHPTIGTGVALAELGRGSDLVLELGVGPIPVTVDGTSARFTTNVPLTRLAKPSVPEIAACLSLAENQIDTQIHEPEIAGVGLTFGLVQLKSKEAVSAAMPDIAAIRATEATHSERGRLGLFCYSREGDTVNARMFAPTGGIIEDPATGSASAALTAYLATIEGRSLTLDIAQGVDMGRSSKIMTEAIFDHGHVVEVAVSGQAVKFAEGRLTL